MLRYVGDEGLELEIPQDARELYHEWYVNRETSFHSKRLDTYSMRLMNLLAVNELKDEVDTEVVRQVIALADWQLMARKLHDPVDAQGTVAAMEQRIRRMLNAKGPRSTSELKRDVNYSRYGLWVWEAAIKNLRSAKEIVWNRKNKIWELA